MLIKTYKYDWLIIYMYEMLALLFLSMVEVIDLLMFLIPKCLKKDAQFLIYYDNYSLWVGFRANIIQSI